MTQFIQQQKQQVKRILLRHSKPSRCDYFLVGFQKCSTSSLWSSLRHHSWVKPGVAKELGFWIENNNSENLNPTDYRMLFPLRKGEKKFIDATVNYITTPGCVEKILDYNPQAKFIILLRDPTERAFSAWKMFHLKFKNKDYQGHKQWDRRSFQMAMNEELSAHKMQENAPGPYQYLRSGLFAQILKEELAIVPKENVFIADAQSDMQQDWEVFQRSIQEFLRLPYQQLSLEHRNITNKAQISDEEHETMEVLRNFYKSHNDELREYLVRPLEHWSS